MTTGPAAGGIETAACAAVVAFPQQPQALDVGSGSGGGFRDQVVFEVVRTAGAAPESATAREPSALCTQRTAACTEGTTTGSTWCGGGSAGVSTTVGARGAAGGKDRDRGMLWKMVPHLALGGKGLEAVAL